MIRKSISILIFVVICQFAMTGAMAQDHAVENAKRAEGAIPFKKRPDAGSSSTSRVVWVTLTAIGLALGGAVLLRQYLQKKGLMPQGKADRIIVNGVKRVSPKLTIYLITVDEKNYLISQSGNQTTMIEHDAAAIEPTS